MFVTSHRGAVLGTLIATSVVVLGGVAAAAGALPSPLQGAAHDALGAAGIHVPGDGDGSSVAATDDTTTTTSTTGDTTSGTSDTTTTAGNAASAPANPDVKGPDPTGPAKFGLCSAFAAGQGTANGNRANSTAFQALATAASTAGQTVDEFCAGATPVGHKTSSVTLPPSTLGPTSTSAPVHHGNGNANANVNAASHGNSHKP